MSWKQFFKPTWKKIVLFLILSFLYITIILGGFGILNVLSRSWSSNPLEFFWFFSYFINYLVACLLIFFWNKFRKIEETTKIYEWGMLIGIIIAVLSALVISLTSFFDFIWLIFSLPMLVLEYFNLYYNFPCLLNIEICSDEGAIGFWWYLIPMISGIVYGWIISLFYWAIKYRKQEPVKVRRFWKCVFVILLIASLIASIFFLFKFYNMSINCDYKIGDYEMRVYDSQGRVTGMVNGERKTEIPDSFYHSQYTVERIIGPVVFPQTVRIIDPNDTYIYELFGITKGNYKFNPSSTTGEVEVNFNAINIPLSPKETHQYHFDWDALARGEEGSTILIDENNDGIFETSIISDNELTCEEFLLKTGKSTSSKLLMMKIIFIIAEIILIIIVTILIIYIIRYKKQEDLYFQNKSNKNKR